MVPNPANPTGKYKYYTDERYSMKKMCAQLTVTVTETYSPLAYKQY